MRTYLRFLPFLLGSYAYSQTLPADTTRRQEQVFRLGQVEVIGQQAPDSFSTVSVQKIEVFNRTDVAKALTLLSGVTLGNIGARNESVVYVRGFDLRQVPIFVDGVPVYVPYDGYVDLGRFTPFDLSEINVSKSQASILYGPNTLGGAINLVSRKPVHKLELNGKAGLLSGQGYRLNLNAGTRWSRFYGQVSLSQLHRNSYPLPARFRPVPFEGGGHRDNAYRDDTKLSLKVGFTPNATDEYVVGYVNGQGQKGTPPYVGTDPAIRARFWQWPYWDKQSAYFISHTALGAKSYAKSRLYYDTFKNALYSYDDTTYSSFTRPYAFRSFYDDYTIGGNAEAGTRLISRNHLKAAVHFKHDVHREYNAEEPRRTFIDQTLSLGLEDSYQITKQLTIVPGISYNIRSGLKAQEYQAKSQTVTDTTVANNGALNVQAGIYWQITPQHKVSASLARKTRFATIKDRYSYRLGAAIPNPYLRAEKSLNYDISYTGSFGDKLVAQASLFRSQLSDVIQQVDQVRPNIFQLQNTGKALFFGADVQVECQVLPHWKTGAHYSYIERHNISNPELRFTGVPVHKGFAYTRYQPWQQVALTGSMEVFSHRYSTSYGTGTGGAALFQVGVYARLYKWISLEGGINNLFDRSYSLTEGFPEEGRNYYLNLVFNLEK